MLSHRPRASQGKFYVCVARHVQSREVTGPTLLARAPILVNNGPSTTVTPLSAMDSWAPRRKNLRSLMKAQKGIDCT